MKHTLVTFLGKGRENKETGYRRANYSFPSGKPIESPFFGLSLAGYLDPDAVVILGTEGSQWGVLVENFALAGEEEEARINLLEAEPGADVTQEMLDGVASIMTRAVRRQVAPRLIPSGKDAGEQYEILNAIADAVPDGDVSFDLTHGYRHLGMVGFLSAFMLERVRNLNVRGLWYGALDMTQDGITPVLQLNGLSRVRRWVNALDRFDATGNYGVFAPLLIEDGVPKDKARCLEEAAFHEGTLNLSDAARKLGTFLKFVRELEYPLAGASGLFQMRLWERLAWVRQAPLHRRQRQLAFGYLERRDFMRASTFGWEAFVTLQCEQRNLSVVNYQRGRRPAIEELQLEIDNGDHPELIEAFQKLRAIRNAVVHGIPTNLRYRSILADTNRLYDELRKAFLCLLPQQAGM